MISTLAFAFTAAILIGIGLHGLVCGQHLMRQLLAFNIIGSGIFLLLGSLGRADPVPQALIITGIVVSLSATALAITLMVRLLETAGDLRLHEPGEEEDA
jgi:multicomponent Na+:H+ antiporter subunit C